MSFFFSITEIPPTALNVNVTCSSFLNMTTRSYDTTVVFFIDATFTLSRVSAIDSIRTTIVEVDGSGNAVLTNFRRESDTFQGIERGPGNVTLVFLNLRPLADKQGFYSVQVKADNRGIGACAVLILRPLRLNLPSE
jgi:hypothetical protein